MSEIKHSYSYSYSYSVSVTQACSHFISEQVLDGEMLGIVWFSTKATTKKGLTVINSETRDSLLDGIPTQAHGRTAIAAGESESALFWLPQKSKHIM